MGILGKGRRQARGAEACSLLAQAARRPGGGGTSAVDVHTDTSARSGQGTKRSTRSTHSPGWHSPKLTPKSESQTRTEMTTQLESGHKKGINDDLSRKLNNT